MDINLKIIIVGASGHGRVIEEIARTLSIPVVGFIDQRQSPGVLGREEDLPNLIDKYQINGAIIAIGDNGIRRSVSERISKLIPLVNLISPFSIIASNVKLGIGIVIAPGVICGPGSKIGDGCLLNTGSTLDHDSRMESYSSLAPGVTVAGNVIIGEESAICLKASVSHRITIGRQTVIGAGSVVLKDLPNNIVAYGIPAKFIRKRSGSDPYL